MVTPVTYIPRRYDGLVTDHLRDARQMVFLSGPRQVGKTSTATTAPGRLGRVVYLSADDERMRRAMLAGADALWHEAGLDRALRATPTLVLDEAHKLPRWKNLLKGFYDQYGLRIHIVVTGSARLDVFKRGGDSLMGRYFPYRMHPFSVAEVTTAKSGPSVLVQQPRRIDDDAFAALYRFGGFPEPLVRNNQRFAARWQRVRVERLLREDLRDLTRIQELAQVAHLAEVLATRIGATSHVATLAAEVGASQDSIRRWLDTLAYLYFCFPVRPWFRNVARSLRKTAKYYLSDWSAIADPGARSENLVACALHKACQFWTDAGLGEFSLHFLRDKQQREVDFLVARVGEPWFLVEVKTSQNAPLTPSIAYFQKQTNAAHAFQLVFDAPYEDADAFEHHHPVVVPARTLLSQLV